ncbi:MAG: sensor domain-containing phosphodiesterase [Alphaproteobacteria bacterium]
MSRVSSSEASIRAERDRFVAFAFASADLLLELDEATSICFAAGAVKRLIGRLPEDLIGTPASELVVPEDRSVLRDLIETIRSSRRVEPVELHLMGGSSGARRLLVSGSFVPDLDNHLYLSLSASVKRAPSGGLPERDRATGLFEKEAFSEAAQARLEQGRALGEDYQLTLLDLSDFDTIRSQIDEQVAESFMVTIGETLRAKSVGHDSAGRIDGDKYGIVHRPTLDVADFSEKLEESVHGMTPAAANFSIATNTVALDGADLSEEETARALVYTMNKFCESQKGEFSVSTLSAGCEQMLEETVQRVNAVKSTIASGSFDFAYQPIVALDGRAVHHYEVLLRNIGQARDQSPFEFITLAEEVGLIANLDMAVCRRAVDILTSNSASDDKLSIAVNLSGRSLGEAPFVDDFLKLIGRGAFAPDRLLFEVTESVEIADLAGVNAVLQKLRGRGHMVCLDDFGSGAAAFEYLRSLRVDYVKIDGSHVRGATSTKYGRSFLKCIVTLCGELGVSTIGEMIEDEDTARLLQEVGIDFGQGHLFGKPDTSTPSLCRMAKPGDKPARFARDPSKMRRRWR